VEVRKELKLFSYHGSPVVAHWSVAFDVWVPANMLIAFCNLIPIAPLDGAKAWRFVPLFLSDLVRRIRSWRRPPATRVVSMELRRIGRRRSK